MVSFAAYDVGPLWASFMPRRKEIANPIGADLISMAVYEPGHFASFSPTKQFERWAAVEVSSFDSLPTGMEAFTVPSGLYAVFAYKGPSTDRSIFGYIFGTWLPASDYAVDDRPHFEVLGAKYKNHDPDSEEDIWIPIRAKTRK